MTRTTRDVFAEALAMASSEEQVLFLNEFSHCLKAACRTSGTRTWDMQTFYIAEQLTPTAVQLLREIAQTYDYLESGANESILQQRRKELQQLEQRIKAMRDEVSHDR